MMEIFNVQYVMNEPNVTISQLVFGFEYILLFIYTLNIFIKYNLNIADKYFSLFTDTKDVILMYTECLIGKIYYNPIFKY